MSAHKMKLTELKNTNCSFFSQNNRALSFSCWWNELHLQKKKARIKEKEVAKDWGWLNQKATKESQITIWAHCVKANCDETFISKFVQMFGPLTLCVVYFLIWPALLSVGVGCISPQLLSDRERSTVLFGPGSNWNKLQECSVVFVICG